MTIAQRFYIVDVFAERPMTGNPLAVVIVNEFLSDSFMQQFAAEVNFSETAFVCPVPEHDGGFRVRLFTPAREVAFAGHPIIGVGWVLRRYRIAKDRNTVPLNLAVGQIPVSFELSSAERELAWFPAPPTVEGPTCSAPRMANALGLTPADIDTNTPIQVISAGTAAVIVPLRTLDALERSALNLDSYSELAADGFPPLVYLFCTQTRQSQNDFSARFFFEAHGVREDPATGNGAAFLGAYLRANNALPAHDRWLRIEQGYQVNRPSLVMLRVRIQGAEHQIQVGGQVFGTVSGELLCS